MAAGIPLVPTHPVDPYASTVQAVKRQYPLLADAPLRLVKGAANLPYEDETYQPWSEGNPFPGNVTVQIRHAQPKTPQDLHDLLSSEALHYLGITKPSGEPVNPQWWALKQQFRGAMTPKDMELARQHWNEEQASGEKRSFDDFMNQSYLDMFFRGYMFPKSQGQEWVDRIGKWPPAQTKILDRMQQLLTTGR